MNRGALAAMVSIVVVLIAIGVYFGTKTDEKNKDEDKDEDETKIKIPTIKGLTGHYTGASLNADGTVWNDLSGKKNNAKVTGGDNLKKVGDYVTGTTKSKIIFPQEVLGQPIPGDTGSKNYTLFHVTKYNTTDKDKRRRIFTGVPNWLSGFWNNSTGVSHRGKTSWGWITHHDNKITDENEWLLSTDKYDMYRANGADKTEAGSESGVNEITINTDNETSDFAIKEVLIYNRNLSIDEIKKVEAYLEATHDMKL